MSRIELRLRHRQNVVADARVALSTLLGRCTTAFEDPRSLGSEAMICSGSDAPVLGDEL